jgi:hypothetical protein
MSNLTFTVYLQDQDLSVRVGGQEHLSSDGSTLSGLFRAVTAWPLGAEHFGTQSSRSWPDPDELQ